MSLTSLFHYLMLNMFRMLVHPSSGACDYLLSYFMGCIALVRCVLVLRCGLAGVVCCGILMQAEAVLQPASGYHTNPAEPHRNTNTHRTRAIQHEITQQIVASS
jgi:hypothetical protein